MWYDGAPHQGQCEGCTTTAWHVKDAVYLNARGVSFALLTSPRGVGGQPRGLARGTSGRLAGRWAWLADGRRVALDEALLLAVAVEAGQGTAHDGPWMGRHLKGTPPALRPCPQLPASLGWMFLLLWNTFSGSYLALILASRW
jgi:hypothetical protein